MTPDATATVPFDGPLDVRRTLALVSAWNGDVTLRPDGDAVWRAWRAASGPVTARYAPAPGGVRVDAWGPGAPDAVRDVPELLGQHDDPSTFRPDHAGLRDLARRFAGVRFPRTREVYGRLLPVIVSQRVTGKGALRSWRDLLFRHGEAAPGPADLRLPPTPARLLAVGWARLHEVGIERTRAETMLRAATHARRLQEAATMGPSDAARRLGAVPGIGVWTIANVLQVTHGDADAVEVGDFHAKNLVSWALAGEPRGTDERMLELLAPYRPHRARVVRLLMLAGASAPAWGPRVEINDIRGL